MSRSPSTIVRFVREEDATQLLDLAEKHHYATVFGFLPFSRTKIARHIAMVIQGRGGNVGLVCLKDGRIVAGAHAIVADYVGSDSGRVMSIQNLFVDEEVSSRMLSGIVALRLLSALMKLAKSKGVQLILLSSTTGISSKGAHKLAEKTGMKFVGGNYVGRLD